MYFRYFVIISPWKGQGHSFEQTWISFTQGCFVPSLVEIGWGFLMSSIYFHYFLIISPCKRAGPFIYKNLNPFHPRMLCANFGWNFLSGSVGKDFLILTMYFHYFVIISPRKRAGPFIWTNLNSLYPRMLWSKFGWNWLSGSGEEDFLIL